MSEKKSGRRKFIGQSVLSAASFMIVPRYVLGGRDYVAPSDKVNIALVGAGGRGRRNVSALLQLDDVQVIAIADPATYWDLSDFYYRSWAGRGPVKDMVEDHYRVKSPNFQVSEYDDFRAMLEQESSLDAILCATPDHTHAYVSLVSMDAGKHIYCEKPLTHNIWEARAVKKKAAATGLATQMGNQLHSSPNVRIPVEYLRAGAIGEVHTVHSWVPATRWIKELDGIPKTSSPLPQGFDWDLWLGPRADRDFNDAYAPVTWRDFWDFGCGALGDFGCHDMDAATWGLDLPLPESVQVLPAGFSNADITPYGEIGYYQFRLQDGSILKMNWYSGGLQPSIPEVAPEGFTFSRRGAMYEGEKGIMITGGSEELTLMPDNLAESFVSPDPTIAPTNGHHRDWVDAIKGGPAASSNFEYATHLTEITLLGVLSLRLGGQKIDWDAENLKAKGLPEADRFIREPVRAGWEMEGLM